MRSVRVIPCLDVTAGRVVKGVRFVDLTDEGDPVELAERYDAEGADEVTFLDITASSEGRDTMVSVVAAHRRAGLHPTHRRGRGAHGRRRPAAPARRGGQGGGQHRGGGASRARARDRRRVRRAVCGGGHRRPGPARGQRLGGAYARGAASGRAATRWPGRSSAPATVPARSSSRPWTATGRETGSTSGSPAPWWTLSTCRWWPREVWASSNTWSTARWTGGPTPCWPPPSSTGGSSRSGRPSSTWRPTG